MVIVFCSAAFPLGEGGGDMSSGWKEDAVEKEERLLTIFFNFHVLDHLSILIILFSILKGHD